MKIRDIIKQEEELRTRWQMHEGDLVHRQKLFNEWQEFHEKNIYGF